MRFYYGKDDGIIVRVESIIILSGLYFLVLSRQKIILNLLKGFLIGFISTILTWFLILMLTSGFTDKSDLIFHFSACVVSILLFLKLEQSFGRKDYH
jgi:hypothetical protein